MCVTINSLLVRPTVLAGKWDTRRLINLLQGKKNVSSFLLLLLNPILIVMF